MEDSNLVFFVILGLETRGLKPGTETIQLLSFSVEHKVGRLADWKLTFRVAN